MGNIPRLDPMRTPPTKPHKLESRTVRGVELVEDAVVTPADHTHPETDIDDGTLLARLDADELITGHWQVEGITGGFPPQADRGVPTHSASLGTLYVDLATGDLYVNSDGGTTWIKIGPGGAGSHDIDGGSHTDKDTIASTWTLITGGVFKCTSHATAPTGEIIPQIKTTTGAPTHTASEGTFCWNSVDNKLYVNNDGATAWTEIGAGGGGTLDDAYDYGGAGAGRQINVASGLPVSLKGDTAVVYVLQALGEGDTGYRFRVRGTGLLEWGLGDGTTDAILTRISADFLGVGPGDTFGADIIAERTAAGGVTVDGVLLKDGLIAAGAVPDTHGVTPSDHHAEAHGAAQHGAESDAAALHDNVAGEIAAITEKVTPVSADLLVIEDSAAANAKKRVQVGNLPGGSGVTYGTPAIVLGTAAGAGAVAEAIRRDSTIVAFDITVPSTQALGDAAATGSAAVAARRDHKHAMPASPLAVGSGGTGVAALPTRPIILSALS